MNDVRGASLVTRVATPLLILAIAAALIVPALRLHANGLWADELFTAYFSDPRGSWTTALLRAAEDVHPPTYAMLVRLLRLLTGGDAASVARGLALACSAATLGVLAYAVRRRVRGLALLATLATAALSGPFLSVVTEARAYALAALLVTIDIALILPLLKRRARPHAPLAVLLIVGGLVHSYLALLGLALAFYLAVIAPTWRSRIGWGVVALLVVMAAQLVARWQAPHVVVDVNGVWFSASPLALADYVAQGLILSLLSPLGLVVLLLAALCVPWRAVAAQAAIPRAALATPAGLACCAIALTVAGAAAYSVIVLPILSRRLFLVLAPFFWLLAAEVFRIALARPRPLATAALLAAALLGALRVVDAGQQAVEPFRESAQAIRAIPACASAPIAVGGLEQPYVRGSEAALFYGYYSPGTDRLVPLSRRAPVETIAARALAIHGASACPVLLWSVHMLRRDKVEEIAALMRRSPRLPRGHQVVVQSFAPPRTVAFLPQLGRRSGRANGFLIRLMPPAGTVPGAKALPSPPPAG
ncbi:hypothetical protein [Sphingomonas jatrophae]|uniref:Dolichyl-phosphate-mannose-protein mannosyltransferase n=1 Tax=Sphingomonas jatrophae TaxID=1166337 RepID=A0A1I6L725_9SPHN|nr:hypothetical protein [Sphingomonas jatrophae]SFR99060.1 hypothetical protein SAMN05192580_2365 [Sphingomonas jatrophae]